MSSYTEGQVHQLMNALEAAGFTSSHLTKMGQSKEKLNSFREVLEGRSEIKMKDLIIDLDADPFVPPGLEVLEHKKGGQFKWDPTKLKLHLSKSQQNGKVIEGEDLQKELTRMSVLNANVLDFLLKKENWHLIPKEWRGKFVFFWGTIYRISNGVLFVRFIPWANLGFRTEANYRRLDTDWLDKHFAVVSCR